MIKKETIKIKDEYIYPKESKIKGPVDGFYREKSSVRVRTIIPDPKLSRSERIAKMIGNVDFLNKKADELYKDYLFLRLFAGSARQTDLFLTDCCRLSRYIAKFKENLQAFERNLKLYKTNVDLGTDDKNLRDGIYDDVNALYDYASGLSDDLLSFREKYYHEFKLASYALVKDKTIPEIEDLIDRVNHEMSGFKSYEEAHDYIIYNSGREIMEAVEELISVPGIKDTKSSYRYFLPTDAIIAFTYPEWIDLFVKFNYVRGKLPADLSLPASFIGKYRNLETKYTIVSICREIR